MNTEKLNTAFKIIITILLVVLIILMNKCNKPTATVTKYETKEVKGKFEAVKPKQEVISTEPKNASTEPKYRTSNEDKFLQGQINVLIAENKALQQFYNEASDSLKNVLFNKAIELKSFNQIFEDDKLKSEVSGIVQGEVKSLKLDYTIKPKTIDLPPQKENVFRLLGGFEYANNTSLTNSIFKANLGVQNRKGNIFRASLDNQQNIYVGYDFSIFSIKR